MIAIELSTAIVLYSVVLGVIIGGIWLYTEISVRRPQRSLGKQYLWRCVYCGLSYLDESAEALSQCPRCGSYNSIEGKEDGRTSAREVEEDERPSQTSRRNPSRGKRAGQRSRGPRRRS